MKHLLTLLTIILTSYCPMIGDDTNGDNSSNNVHLSIGATNDKNTNKHRAPMRVNLEAYYYAETNLIVISYDGEATGEVTVYHDGEIVASDTELNTVLTIDGTPGLYTIEITTDSWTAVGSFEL